MWPNSLKRFFIDYQPVSKTIYGISRNWLIVNKLFSQCESTRYVLKKGIMYIPLINNKAFISDID
jgi:hypothetical protein